MRSLFFAALVLAGTTLAGAQTAGKSPDLKVSNYTITAPVTAPEMARDKGPAPLFAAQKAGGKGIAAGLAYTLGAGAASDIPAVELFAAGNATPIRTITAAELSGVENTGWKLVPAASKSGKTSQSAAYEFTVNGTIMRFIKTVEQKKDDGLPGGKSLVLTLALQSPTAGTYSARIHADVIGRFSGAKGVYTIAPADTTVSGSPSLVIRVKPDPKVENQGGSIVLSTPEVRTGAATPATLASFTVTGTTISFGAHTAEQAKDLAAYFGGKKAAPAMVSVTTVNTTKANPGDTLVYTIVSHNIGTAPAADIVITNPIPAGSSYVEGSAAGAGTTISVQRANKAVSAVTWKYKNVFLPGEERSVHFKVVAR